jgi:hypothetical protein
MRSKPLELKADADPKELQKNESEVSIFSNVDKEKMTRNPSADSLRKQQKVTPNKP